MAKKYRDEIAMVCHDMMKAAQSVGGVSDAEEERKDNALIVRWDKIPESGN